MKIVNDLGEQGLAVAVVTAEDVTLEDTPEKLRNSLMDLVQVRGKEEFPGLDLKKAVRDLLRKGGYRPSGRGKPASEYLAQAARKGTFPLINNLVDINNLLSLSSGLPMSLLDGDVVGDSLLLRWGREGEEYIFNPSGQTIDLKGLICACRADPPPGTPLGNPVKDSMEGKVREGTKKVVALIFSPSWHTPSGELEALGQRYLRLLMDHGSAREGGVTLV